MRSPIGPPGCRTRQITLVTTRLDPQVYRVADRAAWSRQRWQVDTARAQLKPTRPMEVLHGNTVPGVLQAVTGFALADNLVRMIMGQAATLQHLGVARMSCWEALRGLGAPSIGVP